MQLIQCLLPKFDNKHRISCILLVYLSPLCVPWYTVKKPKHTSALQH